MNQYEVKHKDLMDYETCIVEAENPSQARYKAYRLWRETYSDGNFIDFMKRIISCRKKVGVNIEMCFKANEDGEFEGYDPQEEYWIDKKTYEELQQKLELLTAYKATGKTPKEITDGFTILKNQAKLLERDNERLQAELDRQKQLEAKVRFSMLPVNIGDTVWTTFGIVGDYLREKDKPYACKVIFIGVNGEDDYANIQYPKNGRQWQFLLKNIGKTVYLTKEQAEQALEEGESE